MAHLKDDTPHCLHKTIYERFIRYSRLGVFSRVFTKLPAKCWKHERLMIDATDFMAHRTAASPKKWGSVPIYRPHLRWVKLQT